MANPDAAPFSRVIDVIVAPVATAGNDQTSVGGVIREDGVITGVTYIPAATITGAATNNRTLAVVNKGNAGAGSVTPAQLNFGAGVSAAGFVEKAITLSGTPTDLQVSAGDVLVATSTHIGTGITDPGGVLRISIARR